MFPEVLCQGTLATLPLIVKYKTILAGVGTDGVVDINCEAPSAENADGENTLQSHAVRGRVRSSSGPAFLRVALHGKLPSAETEKVSVVHHATKNIPRLLNVGRSASPTRCPAAVAQ